MSGREICVNPKCENYPYSHEGMCTLKQRKFTRDTDDMNEVLADFYRYPVSVKLKDGTIISGPLMDNPDEWTDGYKIGPYAIEKDDVMELTDLEGERQ